MKAGMIDSGRIEAMVAQLKSAAARAQGGVNPLEAGMGAGKSQAVAKPGFADALKASLDQVSATQNKAEHLGQRFSLGDDSVNLSDVMIATQKANISFQATLQVRNKLVSAYQEIMNMQI